MHDAPVFKVFTAMEGVQFSISGECGHRVPPGQNGFRGEIHPGEMAAFTSAQIQKRRHPPFGTGFDIRQAIEGAVIMPTINVISRLNVIDPPQCPLRIAVRLGVTRGLTK